MAERTMKLAERIASRLGEVEGVAAVVLGGSWARGEAHPDSDVDVGIYYRPERPPPSKPSGGWPESWTTAACRTW